MLHTRWLFFLTLTLGAAATALFAYVILSDPKGEAVPASGGRYVEGVRRPAERMNPLFTSGNTTDADIAALVFSGLVRLSADGTPQPDLAERWEITGNGESYVFHLRRGVAWHDGTPFDAEDVVFTYKAIAAPGFKGDPALAQLMQGVVVSARDPQTVEFKLEQAYAPFLSYLTTGILPRHLLRNLAANQLFNDEFNARPVGTGPYRFRRQTERGVELESNRVYYLGPPRITTFEFRTYSDNVALAEALGNGQIDGALFDPEAATDALDSLARDPRLMLRNLVASSYTTVYFNTKSAVFADVTVREALLRATDAQSLVDDVLDGHGERSDGPIPSGSWAHTASSPPPFDPGAAASMLESAGWQRGADGVRRKDGTRLAFTLATSNDARRAALAEALAREWRAIGAEVRVQPREAASYIDDVLLPRRFEAALATVDPGADPDPYPFWHSSQTAPPGRNLSGYSDAAVDDALERGRQTTDTARRRELYAQFGELVAAAAPQIPLYSPVFIYAQRSVVRGVEPSLLFTPASRFRDVAGWYVSTRVR